MTNNSYNNRPEKRIEARRAFLLGGMALLISACASKPAAPSQELSRDEQRKAKLRNLGFVEMDIGWVLNLKAQLLFPTDSSDLNPEGLAELQRIAPVLQDLEIANMRVAGHTDNVGKPEYNQHLSLKRAQAVKEALVRSGLTGTSIEAVGMGMDFPVASNDTPEGRQQNRHVDLIITGI